MSGPDYATPDFTDPDVRSFWEHQIAASFRDETWFTAGLLRLIAKADRINREALRQGFPREVAAWEAYKRGELRP